MGCAMRGVVAPLLTVAAVGSGNRQGHIALELPPEVGCHASELEDVDLRHRLERLVAWATSPEEDPSDAQVLEECTLGWLAASAQRGTPEDDNLLLSIARSPGLLMLSDLGQLRGSGLDLALDPWLREFCRASAGSLGAGKARTPPTWCSGQSFREVLDAQRPSWIALGGALYRNLQPRSPGPGWASCFRDVRDEPLRVSILGTHSGLSMAVASAFAEALREGGREQLTLAYFGHWAWCQNVANCEEPMALMFKAYQQDWAETDDEKNAANFESLVQDLGQLLSRGEPRMMVTSDILLCTRPYLFCWLLRELWPKATEQLPMLHYYSGPLLFDTPTHLKDRVLEAFRSTVLESTLDLVVSSSALQSAWMLAMAGVAVPHVRPHAAQLRGLYVPPVALPSQLRALVLRSTWIQSHMGESFRAVLAKLVRGSGLDGRLEVDWLLSGKFYEYKDIARFHAAVFFPEQPDKLTFWEQYEMSMPLWLPTAEFWVRIHAIGEHRYSVFGHRWEAELPEGAEAAEACGLPAPLFLRSDSLQELPQSDSPLTAALWFYMTDYVLFPHLQLRLGRGARNRPLVR